MGSGDDCNLSTPQALSNMQFILHSFFRYIHLNKAQAQSTNDAQPHNRPTSLRNLVVLEKPSHIPHKMSHAIETMECERPCQRKLQEHLRQQWQAPERGRQRSRGEVPAENRSDEVGEAEDVEAAG